MKKSIYIFLLLFISIRVYSETLESSLTSSSTIAEVLSVDVDKIREENLVKSVNKGEIAEIKTIRELHLVAASYGVQWEEAIERIGEYNNAQAASALCDLVKNTNRAVSLEAVWVFQKISPIYSGSQYIALLDDDNLSWEIKGLILSQMSGCSGVDIERAIARCIGDKKIRDYAITALGDIGTKYSLSILGGIASNENDNAYSIAQHSIELIEDRLKINRESVYGDSEGEYTLRKEQEDISEEDTRNIQSEDEVDDMVVKYLSEKMQTTSVSNQKYQALVGRLKSIENKVKAVQREAFLVKEVQDAVHAYDVMKADESASDVKLKKARDQATLVLRSEMMRIMPSLPAMEKEVNELVDAAQNTRR